MKKENDCSDIPGLISAINDDPDILHNDYTPSVLKLAACGLQALSAILPLLKSDDRMERLRAQRVLEGVINRRYGWVSGQGFPPQSDGEEKVNALMADNGSYQFDAPLKTRLAAVNKWKRWLTQNRDQNEK